MEIERSIVWFRFVRAYIDMPRTKPMCNRFKSSGLTRIKLNMLSDIWSFN